MKFNLCIAPTRAKWLKIPHNILITVGPALRHIDRRLTVVWISHTGAEARSISQIAGMIGISAVINRIDSAGTHLALLLENQLYDFGGTGSTL